MPKRRRNLARGHHTRKEHTMLLARPNFRVLRDLSTRQRDAERSTFSVRKAALRATASARIMMLAQPTRKKKLATLHKPTHFVHPAALTATPSVRINQLSTTPKRALESQIREHGDVLGDQFLKRMEDEIEKYTYYKTLVTPPGPDFHSASHHKEPKEIWPTKSLRKLVSREDRMNYRLLLERLAKPKPTFQPEPMPERISRPLRYFRERLEDLARPKHTPETYKDKINLYKVSEGALNYVPTERILEISKPKKHGEEELPITVGRVKSSALRAIATERLKKLAVPTERKQKQDSDFNEDAFTVNPKALVAKCTKRVEQLAKPFTRKK